MPSNPRFPFPSSPECQMKELEIKVRSTRCVDEKSLKDETLMFLVLISPGGFC